MSHQTTDISSQLNHPERDLAFQSIENARDLGGYQTVDGGHTRFGVFVRTADMDRVVEADRVAMRDHGISLVIDLRMQREREEKPNLFSRGSLGDPA
ncbi:MAG: tyrosine-protein phosphatase, partial [Pseudomonadales bacterium]|nr:tyrosine-protein phosphatase [Pseudomonadales bacterium]